MKKIKIPTIDVNEINCKIVEIGYKDGDMIESEDIIFTLETTKASEDIISTESGIIKYIVSEGDTVEFGKVACMIFENIEEYNNYQNEVLTLEEKKIHIPKGIKLTQKAIDYVKRNKIDLILYKDELPDKVIFKLKDIKKIINLKKNKPVNATLKSVNNRRRIVIIGAGNSGEVVADILMDYPEFEIIGFVDDKPMDNFSFYGIKIIYDNVMEFPIQFNKSLYDAIIISFTGNLKNKEKIINIYKENEVKFINAIDKTAKIGRNVKLGIGNIIGANTYIGTSTVIGNHNWIAASVNIDHHNILGDFNLLGPNFTSPGIVQIGNLNKFGANSSLSNYISVGDSNIIMNNIAIYKNIKSGEVLK